MAGAMSIGVDPYFMAAYNSPNFLANQYVCANDATKVASTTPAQVFAVPANANSKTTEKEKGSGPSTAAITIVSAAALIGMGMLTRKAYKLGQGEGCFSKVIDGSKKLIEELVGNYKNWRNNKFTITKAQSGEWVCTVPGEKHTVRLTDAAKLGIDTNCPGISEKTSKLLQYILEDNGNTFVVKNGKVVKYVNASGEDLLQKFNSPTADGDIKYKKSILDLIKAVEKKDRLALKKIRGAIYTDSANNTVRKFMYRKNSSGEIKNRFVNAETNRFLLDDSKVGQWRLNHQSSSEALKRFLEDDKFDALKMAYAECEVPGVGKLVIENGKVTGMYDGKVIKRNGDSVFDDMKWRYPKVFDSTKWQTPIVSGDVLKNKDGYEYKKIVYAVK